MQIKYLGTKFVIVLLIGLVLAGGYGSVRADSQDVIVSVSTDKNAYGWGETVVITVSVTNIGSSTLDFIFADTHQAGYSIYLLQGQTRKPVWTTLNDIYFPMVTYLTLEPGETKNYVFQWTQATETDTTIKPATCVVRGYFVGTWTWSEQEFDIRGRGYRGH